MTPTVSNDCDTKGEGLNGVIPNKVSKYDPDSFQWLWYQRRGGWMEYYQTDTNDDDTKGMQ